MVGRIWEEARTLPARDAVAVAAPRASPEQFRQLAIMIAVGVVAARRPPELSDASR